MTEHHDPHRSALFTDLYELAMLGAYDAEGLAGTAVFELFFRSLPPHRNYVVAAGLDDVLDFLEHLRFRDADIDWLAGLGRFDDGFLQSLAALRFSGDVHAVPEGTVVFPNEPMVQVVAPLPEAQLLETWILNQMHVQSLVATKAARIARTAGQRAVTDFGSRRAHGSDAAIKAARAGYVAGIAGTSNVLAARRYGIPCLGTMAHSYIQAHDDELAAFEAFSKTHPGTTLLVDTYDTLQGVERVIELARRQGSRFDVQAIRLDSGPLVELIPRARSLLDDAGLGGVKILASGGLDEYGIRELIDAGVPVDGFGIGTALVVSNDAPHVDLSYKLVEYESRPRMKLSTGKVSLPGRKQVFRRSAGGRLAGDTLATAGEDLPGQPLLEQVMRNGKRTAAGRWTLEDARLRCARELDALPSALHALTRVAAEEAYPVAISPGLDDCRRRLLADLKDRGYDPTN
ncbi:MAG: nicotinate phosphoribosyltransferase [Gammaproteobacteria bacterium]|nr:nicotinate phosphoribosyltransferase [Gammaproteobacteria bacterium]